MRVVVDTNVFVSSFFGGNPRKVIDLWKTGKVLLCLSGSIVKEYTDVLQRLGLVGTRELAELLQLFRTGYFCLFTSETPRLRIVRSDPDDDKFIECAVALKAKSIISGDKGLLAVGDYMGISILTPRDFLRTVPPTA
ncbi:MAG: putative toxin-antitoxin system toxin component, PIN family [Desulfohalobiaceae bacterium]